MKYTPACQPVDLMINGEYKGSYDFCDQVEQGKGRIEVTKIDKKSINEPEITGGYIIEADHWDKREEVYAEFKRGVAYTIKYPDEEDIFPEQLNYINNTFNIYSNIIIYILIKSINILNICDYLFIYF